VTLAVDAFNLGADRRGMGRYVRRVLAGLQALGESDVSLIVRDRRTSQSLAGEFDYPLIEPRDLRRTPAAAVWYPWNGMRFRSAAPALVTINDTFAFDEPDLAAKRERYHQNVGKQDRGVETKAPHRLQCHFGGKFRIETQIEKAARFLPHRTIFRQIPPRLPHHPYRWNGLALSAEHLQQRLYPHAIGFAGVFHKDSYKFLCSVC